MKTCMNCNLNYAEQTSFCRKCGKKLTQAPIDTTTNCNNPISKWKKYILASIIMTILLIISLVVILTHTNSSSKVNISPESVIEVLLEAENGNLAEYENILCPYIFEGYSHNMVAYEMNDAWKKILIEKAREHIKFNKDVYGDGYRVEYKYFTKENSINSEKVLRAALTKLNQVLEKEYTYEIQVVVFEKNGEKHEKTDKYSLGKINGKWYLLNVIHN